MEGCGWIEQNPGYGRAIINFNEVVRTSNQFMIDLLEDQRRVDKDPDDDVYCTKRDDS